MTVSASVVRQRLAAKLAALGWSESRWTGPGWPSVQETQAVSKRFAVWVSDTVYPAPVESARLRRPDAVGSLVTSTARVWWAYRLRADAAVADLDAALDQEDALVEALLQASRTDGLRVAIVRRSRSTAADGTLIVGEIEVAALHQVPI